MQENHDQKISPEIVKAVKKEFAHNGLDSIGRLSDASKRIMLTTLLGAGEITQKQYNEAIEKVNAGTFERMSTEHHPQPFTQQEIWAYGNRKARRHMEAIAKNRMKRQ